MSKCYKVNFTQFLNFFCYLEFNRHTSNFSLWNIKPPLNISLFLLQFVILCKFYVNWNADLKVSTIIPNVIGLGQIVASMKYSVLGKAIDINTSPTLSKEYSRISYYFSKVTLYPHLQGRSSQGDCPERCVCKWKGGKETVGCANASLERYFYYFFHYIYQIYFLVVCNL